MSSGDKKADINVTPLIDVLLVLLVIFLVSMPMVMRMERVDVPPKSDDNVIPEPSITVMVHADATVSVDEGSPIAETDLPSALAPKLALAHNVFVGFDDGVPWREVVGSIDRVRTFDGVVVALKMHD